MINHILPDTSLIKWKNGDVSGWDLQLLQISTTGMPICTFNEDFRYPGDGGLPPEEIYSHIKIKTPDNFVSNLPNQYPYLFQYDL